MQHKLRAQVAAIMLLARAAPTFLAHPAAAQKRATTAPVINSLALNADEALSPGSTLNFQLSAAPKAKKAEVVLGKSGIVVPLSERSAGNYSGSYVVRRS